MDLDDEELKATRILNGTDKNSKARFKNEIKVSKEIQDAMCVVSETYRKQRKD